MSHNSLCFVFFGTDTFSIGVLEELQHSGLTPRLIVTVPDKPKGRGLQMAPPPVAVWAAARHIPVLQPTKLSDPEFLHEVSIVGSALCIVASYGKIIPRTVLDIPAHGVLNIHPSLLPLYRGPSPIESQILDDEKNVGVSIMLLDEEMDHGPIVVQKKVPVASPVRSGALSKTLATEGGRLLAETIEPWVAGTLTATEQNHPLATYTKKFTSADGKINLLDDGQKNFRTFCALADDPGVFFIHEHKGKELRVKITDATYKNGQFLIKRVVPEGRKETNYEEFQCGYK